MKEERLIKKIKEQAGNFKSRATISPEDRKRHDLIKSDECKTMHNAYHKLGWSYAKIGGVFDRDSRTVKQAVRRIEQEEDAGESKKKYPAIIFDQVIRDEVVHYSSGQRVGLFQEKHIHVYSTVSGSQGNLVVWVELSPDDLPSHYTMLGTEEVSLANEKFSLPWNVYSEYARLAVQVRGAGAGNAWTVKAILSGSLR